MARPGTKPKPRALKLIEGDRASRINDLEPIPSDVAAECPPEVGPAVRAIWDYTVRELQVMGTVVAADRDALLAYCHAVVNHRRASALLEKSEVLIKGIHGNPVRNPALAVQRDSAELIRKFAGEFGLTPSARTRIVVEGGAGDEGDASVFAGNG